MYKEGTEIPGIGIQLFPNFTVRLKVWKFFETHHRGTQKDKDTIKGEICAW